MSSLAMVPGCYPIGLGDVLVLGLPAPRQFLDMLERQREVADQLGLVHRAGHALLVLRDFELMPIRPPGPEDLYDVIGERHEHLL